MFGPEEDGLRSPQEQRIGRRRFVQGASAAVGGVAAAAYVKPGLRALGVPSTLAAISGGPRGNNGVGNGADPQPRGNPPVNDGPGTRPGKPGNRGGKP